MCCSDTLIDANHYTVRLGSILARETDPDLVVSSVDRVFMNPLYDSTLITNDVGLLRLSRPVVFTDTIRPICLPTPDVDLNKFKVCVSTGFGRTSFYGLYQARFFVEGEFFFTLFSCSQCSLCMFFFSNRISNVNLSLSLM